MAERSRSPPGTFLLVRIVNLKAQELIGSRLANANFYLLHISLLREYLNLEFSSIAEQIPFEYDLERIIDDFILMGIFVGNDFLPHLPDLHINEGALERIWTIYKSILPTAGKSLPCFSGRKDRPG